MTSSFPRYSLLTHSHFPSPGGTGTSRIKKGLLVLWFQQRNYNWTVSLSFTSGVDRLLFTCVYCFLFHLVFPSKFNVSPRFRVSITKTTLVMYYRAIILSIKINLDYPGYQRLFLACGELLRGPTHLRPKAEATNDEVARAFMKT